MDYYPDLESEIVLSTNSFNLDFTSSETIFSSSIVSAVTNTGLGFVITLKYDISCVKSVWTSVNPIFPEAKIAKPAVFPEVCL